MKKMLDKIGAEVRWFVCVCACMCVSECVIGVSATLTEEHIMAVRAHYGALAGGAVLNNAWTLFMSRVHMSSETHFVPNSEIVIIYD